MTVKDVPKGVPNNIGWIGPATELREEFAKGSFEKIIECCNKNELNLMCIWFGENEKKLEALSNYGTGVLDFFKCSIEDDPKILAAFKLGELAGHFDCLNDIWGQAVQDNIENIKLELAKSCLPNHSTAIEEVLIAILKEAVIVKEKLRKEVAIELEELEDIVSVLIEQQLVNISISGNTRRYSLTDWGFRIARRLRKEKETGN